MTLEEFYGPEITARMQTPLPDGYVPYRACLQYFQREGGASRNSGPAGSPACQGARWRHGPLHFEKFVTDVEPPRDGSGPLRMTIWQRFARTDRPKGWLRGPASMSFRLTGFATADGADGRTWSGHARRHLQHWKKLVAAGKREVAEVSLEEYLAAYARADQDFVMKAAFPSILRDKAAAHGNLFHLVASRRPGGPLDAGLAYLYIPEAGTSTHVSAFMAGDGKDDSASTGLIAHWFARCAEDGIPILDFGFFWAPGDPTDWRGFSRFKAQFGVRLISYPPPLFRFSGTWRGKPSA
jgi:hypothetical protein